MLLLTALLACTSRPPWLEPPSPIPDAACPNRAASPAALGTLPLRIRVGEGLDLAEAAFYTRWAASWWRERGLRLTIGAPWSRTADEEVFAQRAQDLPTLIRPAEEQLERPVRPWVDVVFVSRLARPSSPAGDYFDPLVGFTVAPGLDPAVDRLAEGATPTVFVALDEARALPRERARFVLAHELGHALSLRHVEDQENLMGKGFPRCAPTLADPQKKAARTRARLVRGRRTAPSAP